MSPLPLAGLRVLDLSRVLAGPYCTMQLADLGAEVIKVERPGTGDETRLWGPPFVGGESAYFLCCNRNKRSLTLDLATRAGRELLARLLDWADVLVENFLPGTLDRWGFSTAELRARYPRLITCHISGFGQTGPRRDEAGYDLLIQAGSGLMSITGEPDGLPTKVGVAITDVVAGLFASQSILAALVGRSLSGLGTDLDIALFDCALACLVNVGQGHLVTGETLAEALVSRGIGRLVVVGLATDYCVAYSALDAAKLGYQVTVLEGACRAIDLNGSLAAAMTETRAAGVIWAE